MTTGKPPAEVVLVARPPEVFVQALEPEQLPRLTRLDDLLRRDH